MATAQIHSDEAVHSRLDSLGLEWPVLEDAFKYGLDEASGCNDHDAGFCKGVLLYSRIGRKLQETLKASGWRGGRPHNQQCVWNEELGVRVLHVTGNLSTGDPDPIARSAPERPGGAARHRLIEQNSEESLHDHYPDSAGWKRPKTWFLLYRMDARKLKSELSYPLIGSTATGDIALVERLILPEVPLPPGMGKGDDLWVFDESGEEDR
ncbi:hypothetical protein AB0K52_20120 [Glycomyces sp. NPDC049804]|uniref:hypothetical protein n=1 Tax=Glycomyces sp. NPDC049804 TaxID=3154363 RepID=UPI003433901C